jgi:hypothetical protein
MSFFNKIAQNANTLFSKAIHDKKIFSKINNFTKHANNTIQKVGNFIKPVAQAFGYDGMLDRGMQASKSIANGLEKYIMPIHDVRQKAFA